MYQHIGKIFNNGENDGDVRIICKNNENFIAHSFIIKYCSDLFRSVFESQKNNTDCITNENSNDNGNSNNIFVWYLIKYNYFTVFNIIKSMYEDTTINLPFKNFFEYYDFIEFIMPTNILSKSIKSEFDSHILSITSLVNSKNKKPDYRIIILKLLASFENVDNTYINTVRDIIYVNYSSIMLELYFIADLYINNKVIFNKHFTTEKIGMEMDIYSLDNMTIETINKIREHVCKNL